MAMLARSQSRGGAKVVWLAVHTTEGIMRATALRDWATWPGSSHASSDETGALLTPADGFVPYERAAWTLRNGNNISENIEQCGWARWTRAEWLSRPKLLDATARWLADRSRARGIPLVKLSPADVKAHKSGVLGHVDYTLGTGDGTHTDPGKDYPWDVVLDAAKGYAAGKPGVIEEDDMTPEEHQMLAECRDRLRGDTKRPYDMLQSIDSAVADVQYRVRGTHPDMDSFQVIQWQLGQLAAQKPGGLTADDVAALIPDGLAQAVVDKLAARLAS